MIGANSGNQRGRPEAVAHSVREIETVLGKAGMAGRWPVLRGAQSMRYQFDGTLGTILRCYHVHRDRTFGLLCDRLSAWYGRRDEPVPDR